MDMDLEYSRFMAELDSVPSPTEPAPQPQPVASEPAPQPQPVAIQPTASQQISGQATPARPTLPPPPLDAVAPAHELSTLPPPPGRPPALPMPPPDASNSAAMPATRPSGPPPPIQAPAVFSAPAQPPSLPAYEPPSYPPPSMNSSYNTSYGYGGGHQNGGSSSGQQQSFNPTLFDPQAIRDEILGEKKDGTKKKKKVKEGALRAAGGETWFDDKMDFWAPNDFRIFVGNLGPEVNEDALQKAFNHFPSYSKCRIVKDYKKNKAKGYGFVSLMDQTEGIKALKQVNGTYIGNRPCQLKKSSHDVRNVPDAVDDNKKRKAMLANPMGRITTKRMR